MVNDRLFSNKAGKTAVHLKCLYDGAELYELAQTLSAVFRHSKLFLYTLVYALYILIICIRYVDDLSAVLRKKTFSIVSYSFHRSFKPVIAVDYVIRVKLGDDIIVHYIVLNDNLVNDIELLDYTHPLVKADGGEAVEAYHCRVAEYTHDYTAVFCSFF